MDGDVSYPCSDVRMTERNIYAINKNDGAYRIRGKRGYEMEANMVCVGLVSTDAGEKTMIVSWETGKEGASYYYNNNPFGIVGCHGFSGLCFKPIDVPKNGDTPAAFGELEAVLEGNLYGEVKAVISCEEGLVLIRDTTFFTGDFLRKGSREVTPLADSLIALSDGEDTLDEDELDELACL